MGKQEKRKPTTEIKKGLKDKYGGGKVYGWSGYVGDPTGAAVLGPIEGLSAKLGITPAYFNTIAVGEGLNLFIDPGYGPNPPLI